MHDHARARAFDEIERVRAREQDYRCMIRMMRSLSDRVWCEKSESYVYNPLVYYYAGTVSAVVAQVHCGQIQISKR